MCCIIIYLIIRLISGHLWWLRQWRIYLQRGRPEFDPWVGQIPWRKTWQPTPVFLPGLLRARSPIFFFFSNYFYYSEIHITWFIYLVGKNLHANTGDIRDEGSVLVWEDLLEEGVVTHSSVLAWEIPWTEEPDRLQYIASRRVRHDCVT